MKKVSDHVRKAHGATMNETIAKYVRQKVRTS